MKKKLSFELILMLGRRKYWNKIREKREQISELEEKIRLLDKVINDKNRLRIRKP